MTSKNQQFYCADCGGASNYSLVLLPVDDDGGDLLVHEDEDGGEDGKDWRQEDVDPPWVSEKMLGEEESMRNHPVPPFPGRLELRATVRKYDALRLYLHLAGHHKLGSGQTVQVVQRRHQQDPDDHREVCHEVADGRGKVAGVAELLE